MAKTRRGIRFFHRRESTREVPQFVCLFLLCLFDPFESCANAVEFRVALFLEIEHLLEHRVDRAGFISTFFIIAFAFISIFCGFDPGGLRVRLRHPLIGLGLPIHLVIHLGVLASVCKVELVGEARPGVREEFWLCEFLCWQRQDPQAFLHVLRPGSRRFRRLLGAARRGKEKQGKILVWRPLDGMATDTVRLCGVGPRYPPKSRELET